MSKQYQYLFTPIKLGSVVLPNRIVFTAHLTNLAENNLPSERQAYYYAERARGGAGLIITEELSVHPTDRAYEKLIDAFEEAVIPRYRLITGMVRRHGAKIFAQLNHNGNQAASTYTRLPVWGPSPVPDPLFREVPKEMDLADIGQLIEGYALAARFVKEGGFDGLELQGSHSSIIRQYLSPLTNLRQDRYGGSIENRMRLLCEIAEAVRRVVGREFVMGLRLSGDELVEGGLSLSDTVDIARRVQDTDLFDYINTSVSIATRNLYLVEGSMAMPPGYSVYMSSAIRQVVKLPVIAVGRIKDPAQAEQILRDGHADLIGMVRAQIADPELANKSLNGMAHHIRTCLSCNQDCIGRVGINRDIGCIQNPAAGREKAWGIGTLKPAAQRKRVLVIGAGPAGLEAAKTAALRGHKVFLWEKDNEPGGQVKYASKLPRRSEFGEVIRNLSRELRDTAATLKLGHSATAENIISEKPDAVILATGSIAHRPPYPGFNQNNVLTVWQLLTEKFSMGNRVIIIDQLGYYQATGVAELLANQGKKVEIISPSLYIGQGLGRTLDLDLWYKRARKKGITLTPNVSVIAIDGNTIKAVHNYSGREVLWQDVDNVVLATPHRADEELYNALKGKVPELYRIGDCLTPRRVDAAILDGHRVARSL